MLFYATFISGFDPLVAKLMHRDGMDVVRLMDGAVEFESKTIPADIPYLNNIFIVLRRLSHTNLNKLAQDVIANQSERIPFKPKNFRVFVSQENELVSLPGSLMHDVVETFTQISRSPFSPRQAEAEFWLLARSEGVSYCLYRLTSRQKALRKRRTPPGARHVALRMQRSERRRHYARPVCRIWLHPVRTQPFKGILPWHFRFRDQCGACGSHQTEGA